MRGRSRLFCTLIVIPAIILLSLLSASGQDLVSSGSNSWIFHTPDDGRTSLHIAPGSNGANWNWNRQYYLTFDGKFNVMQLPFTIGGLVEQDKFIHNGNSIGNYSLGWHNDSWSPGAPTGHFSGYAGLKFFTNQQPRLVIQHGGNVGIGVETPSARLHVLDGGFRHGGSGEINIDAIGTVGGRFKILDNGNVGIGIQNPSEKLEVNGNLNIGLNSGAATGYGNRLSLRGLDDSQSWDPMWLARYNSAANQTELRVNVGDDFGQAQDMFVVGTHHWNGGTWFPHFSVHASGNIGIGTTNPQQKLHVKGTVYSTEVKVDVAAGQGPDYVFTDSYRLPSLEEVKAYISQHKHLPEVPAAKEMEANGVNLGEMNLLLLKKIEELTLHLIKQEERIKQLETDQLKK